MGLEYSEGNEGVSINNPNIITTTEEIEKPQFKLPWGPDGYY